MYNSLSGEITHKGFETLHLQGATGEEWDLLVSQTSLSDLPPLGSPAKVYTWLHCAEDIFRFYGFASLGERSLFLELIKVSGVGPRTALKYLSGLSWKDFAAALEAGDAARLSRVPGLGLKTAQKIILALKGKVNLDEAAVTPPGRKSTLDPALLDLIQALCEMGFERRRVEDSLKELAGAEDLQDLEKSAREQKLFQRALMALSGASNGA